LRTKQPNTTDTPAPKAAPPFFSKEVSQSYFVQTKCATCEQEEKIQKKATPPFLTSANPGMVQLQGADEFPHFSQGDAASCGAASLVSALMIWDKEKKAPTQPNEMLATACNIILVHIDNNKAALIKHFDDQGKKGADLYDAIFGELTRVRDLAKTPGSNISQTDYRSVSNALVLLFRSEASGGLSKGGIEAIQNKLGLSTGIQSKTQSQSFDDLFTDPVLVGLTPGQIAQISWYVKDKQGNLIIDPIHAFLIGRFKRGPWFLSDQGMSPPTEMEAGSLNMLKMNIWSASKSGASWIYTGTKPMLLPAPWTGVSLLGDRNSVEKQAENIILRPGDFIAEIDNTTICCGEKIIAWDFVARRYSYKDAELAFDTSGSGHGGLIIENPIGLFHVFKISPITDKDNLRATTIDEGDSKGGFLSKKGEYYHAWLKLCPPGACSSAFFKYR